MSGRQSPTACRYPRRTLLALGCSIGVVFVAQAHGVRAGPLRVDHPYALPTSGPEGWVHLRAIDNQGHRADRLLGASTARAKQVELVQRSSAAATAASNPVPAIELPPHTRVSLRHDSRWALRLRGLREPLREGERFALTLRFEHAGDVPVKVWVQSPRAAAESRGHAH
jgi:hypothetical protein